MANRSALSSGGGGGGGGGRTDDRQDKREQNAETTPTAPSPADQQAVQQYQQVVNRRIERSRSSSSSTGGSGGSSSSTASPSPVPDDAIKSGSDSSSETSTTTSTKPESSTSTKNSGSSDAGSPTIPEGDVIRRYQEQVSKVRGRSSTRSKGSRESSRSSPDELSVTGQGASQMPNSSKNNSGGPAGDGSKTKAADPSQKRTQGAAEETAQKRTQGFVAEAGVETGNGPIAEQAQKFEQQVLSDLGGKYGPEDVRIERNGDKLVAEYTKAGRKQQAKAYKQQVVENLGPKFDSDDVRVEWQGNELVAEYTKEGREQAETIQQNALIGIGYEQTASGEFRAPEAAGTQTLTEKKVQVGLEGIVPDSDPSPRDMTSDQRNAVEGITPDSDPSPQSYESVQREQAVQQAKKRLANRFENSKFAETYGLERGEGFEVVGRDALGPEDVIHKGSVVTDAARLFGFDQAASQAEAWAREHAAGEQTTGVAVRITDQGLSQVEQNIEAENPAVDVNVYRGSDGLQVKQLEKFGDRDWTPFVEGDPVESTFDSATKTVGNALDDAYQTWAKQGGAEAYLTALSPGTLLYEAQTGTDVYGKGSEAATEQFAQTTLQLVNLPGYVSGGFEAVETGAFVAGSAENAREFGEAAYAVGQNAAEWAAEHPQQAAGAGLGIGAGFVVGSIAETAALSRASRLTGRRIPRLRSIASMDFDEFRSQSVRIKESVQSGIDTARARTPSIRLEKDAESGVFNVDASARRQIRGEARVTRRQVRDVGDRAVQATPTVDEIATGVQNRAGSARQALPGRDDLPNPDFPSPGEVISGAKSGVVDTARRPVGRANELNRAIRREVTSARFRVAEAVRRDRERQLRERARVRMERELVNAQFALSEFIDDVPRPRDVRSAAPSRTEVAEMATIPFERAKRRTAMERKNLEFRLSGVRRGASSTATASLNTVEDIGGSLFATGRRFASELQDIDEYGLRITASDEWKAVREKRVEPDFSAETLAENVDNPGSGTDLFGQTEGVQSRPGDTGDAASTIDQSLGRTTETRETTKTKTRSQAAEAQLMDPARVESEFGPQSRPTFGQRRKDSQGRVGVLAGALQPGALTAFEDVQAGRIGAGMVDMMAGAGERIEAAERMVAPQEFDGVGQLQGFETIGRVDTGLGIDVGAGFDVGQVPDQDIRLDQRTRIDIRGEFFGPDITPPPRTPNADLPGFQQDSGPEDPFAGMNQSDIEFLNPVATASEAFFGGFDVFQQPAPASGGGGGEFDPSGGEL